MDCLYFNRELSWLRFNERVLEEGCDPATPLLERLRFVSIFASNLDEFYMVRVGSLRDRTLLGREADDSKTGMSAKAQINAADRVARTLYPRRDRVYAEVMRKLGLTAPPILRPKDLDGKSRRFLKGYFERELLPLLSPQIIDAKHPFPHLENRAVCLAVRLKSKGGSLYGLAPLPACAERLVALPGGFILAEDLLLKYADLVFNVYKVESQALLRVTRSADLDLNESLLDDDLDYRSFMNGILKRRSRLAPVRLETDGSGDEKLISFFLSKLSLEKSQCFKCASPLDLGFVKRYSALLDPRLKKSLEYPPARPQWPASLPHGGLLSRVTRRDLLLFYPYDSMRPLLDLLREAAEDRDVVSIKITLYRVGPQSQIVQCLCAAAENGKDVTVMIELRARFDEQSNIGWSGMLEEAGCRVIYGVDGYKVHAKLLLITRRSDRHLSYITHVGTGNYNETTARLYCDLNLITADEEIGRDAALFFHNLTISNLEGGYRRLLVAPSGLKSGLAALIRAEAQKGKNGRIILKLNSLTDRDLIDELIDASRAGVRCSLIVRGICCLRPGISGATENIEVRSIVGRFLEHSRVYCFGEGDEMKLYISSADLMTRNTARRVELAAPVLDRKCAADIRAMLEVMLRDNVKARLIGPDGAYRPVRPESAGQKGTPLSDPRFSLGELPEGDLDCQKYFLSLAANRAPLGSGIGARPYRLNRPGFFEKLFGRRP